MFKKITHTAILINLLLAAVCKRMLGVLKKKTKIINYILYKNIIIIKKIITFYIYRIYFTKIISTILRSSSPDLLLYLCDASVGGGSSSSNCRRRKGHQYSLSIFRINHCIFLWNVQIKHVKRSIHKTYNHFAARNILRHCSNNTFFMR